jgi:glycerol-3-phosphate acyltransferase PlsY
MTQSEQIQWAVAAAAAYLCGSVPFGLLIGLSRGIDLRKAGSGNIGATNAGRVMGRKVGLICFFLDLLKGFLPVLLTGAWFGLLGGAVITVAQTWCWLGVAVAAVMGHVAPVWLKFRGGKGVATSLGVLLGIWPYLTLPAIAAGLTWLLFASVFRYVSLASIVAAVALPIYLAVTAATLQWPRALTTPLLIVTGVMALLIVVRHRGNALRLLRGTESRLR